MTLVASAEAGLLRSTDGGASFRPLDRTPPSQLVWTADGLLRLGYDTIVRDAERLGDEAEPIGELPASPSAATATDDEVLAAADDGSVVVSSDHGRTWRLRLRPAT